jgi:ABC-type multidrug transport system fused ATPase/permease subunit
MNRRHFQPGVAAVLVSGTQSLLQRLNLLERGVVMVNFTTDQWIIVALVFVLGLLIGMFMVSGLGRKWKRRYKDEVEARESWQAEHARLQEQISEREKEWRERDSLRAAALKERDRDRPITQAPVDDPAI